MEMAELISNLINGMTEAVSSAVSIAAFILTGLSLMWMARACGLPKSWLSWIPIGSDYLFGRIAEKGAGRNGSACKPYGKILLRLSIALCAVSFVFGMATATLIVGMLLIFPGLLGSLDGWKEALDQAAVPAIVLILALVFFISCLLAVVVLSVIYVVYRFIALWHIYVLYAPDKAKLCLALSIVGTWAVPMVGALAIPSILTVLARTRTPNIEDETKYGSSYRDPWIYG